MGKETEVTTEEQKNKKTHIDRITLGHVTLTRIALTPYGYGMILEALRVLAENDESLRADAMSLRNRIERRVNRNDGDY